MPYMKDTLGAMLQGVNQQPQRLRVNGQVGKQINYESSVSTGLTSRAGTTEVARLTGNAVVSSTSRRLTDTDLKYDSVTVGARRYIIGYKARTLHVWDEAGASLSIRCNKGCLDYVGDDMTFYSDNNGVDNNLVCVNRDKVIAKSSFVEGTPASTVLVTCLGGAFQRTYRVTITVGGRLVEGVYTTPDGTGKNHATRTSSGHIIAQLAASLLRQSLPVGFTVITKEDVMVINALRPMTASISDGEYGGSLRVATDRVDDITDLPRFAQHGYVVKVEGEAASEDDFYLRFIAAGTTGFTAGRIPTSRSLVTGTWKETADPTAANALDPSTLPHQIRISDVNAVSFAQAPWAPRRAGDAESALDPSFVGAKIRDSASFEDRIVFSTSVGTLVMSRTKFPYDFYRETATVVSASDPIDIKSSKREGLSLDRVVPFDKNLLLLADPGDAQFVVTGGNLTPRNASMVLTTDYTVDSDARPVTTGRTVLMPFTSGNFSGINEFFTKDQSNTNGADPLTAGNSKFITGRITHMASAGNFSRVAIVTDTGNRLVWIYQFLWNGSEKVQSSWYQLEFPDRIHHLWFDGSKMFVIMRDNYTSVLPDPKVILLSMDLNRTRDSVGWHITMDRKTDAVVSAENKVTAFYQASVVQGEGCESPGQYAEILNTEIDQLTGVHTYTLAADTCPAGASVITGINVVRVLEPTMPRIQNREGQVVASSKITVADFDIHMEDSGDIRATLSSPYRPAIDTFPRRFALDDELLDTKERGIMDYVLRVPWRERADRSTLTITSEDQRPDTILEIEWTGQVLGLKGRPR